MIQPISKEDVVKISLLGRLVFPEAKLKEIVTKNKRTPDAYVKGYNSCDGKSTVTEIAKIIGVSQSTLTPILKDWEIKGIIFEADSPKGKTYRKLYPLPAPKEKSPKTNEVEEPIINDTQIQEVRSQEEQTQEIHDEEEVKENEQ